MYHLLCVVHALSYLALEFPPFRRSQSGACVQLFVTDVTFKMLGFLMLDQDLFVVKFSVTVPAKNVSKPVRKRLKDLNDTGDRKHLS